MLDREARVSTSAHSQRACPGVAQGFLVTPHGARAALIDVKYSTDNHCDVLTQATLAAFLAEGHLTSHSSHAAHLFAASQCAGEQNPGHCSVGSRIT